MTRACIVFVILVRLVEQPLSRTQTEILSAMTFLLSLYLFCVIDHFTLDDDPHFYC